MGERCLSLLPHVPRTPLCSTRFHESCRRTSQEGFAFSRGLAGSHLLRRSLTDPHFHGGFFSSLPYTVAGFFCSQRQLVAQVNAVEVQYSPAAGTADKRWREAGHRHPCVGQPLALLSHQSNSLLHFLHDCVQTSSLCSRGKFNINVFATLNHPHPGQQTWNSVQTKYPQNCHYRCSFFLCKLSDINIVDLPRLSANQTRFQKEIKMQSLLPYMKIWWSQATAPAEEGWTEERTYFPFTSLFLQC